MGSHAPTWRGSIWDTQIYCILCKDSIGLYSKTNENHPVDLFCTVFLFCIHLDLTRHKIDRFFPETLFPHGMSMWDFVR